jgi:hypothetical protein
MARLIEPSAEQEAAWKEWVETRPPGVREVAERFEPWSLYRLKSTGQRVTLRSIASDGTVTVNVTGQFNLVTHERAVFGIDPDDLEPCDPPPPGEPVGSAMTQQEVEDNIDALRVQVRPDLWYMGEDGVARRRH